MSTFTCDNCGETYEMGWSDEKARAESDALFPGQSQDAVVCDDCFNEIIRNWTLAGQPQP